MLKVEHVLVVCVGNICRSPTVAFMLSDRLPQVEVSSAGLSAVVDSDMHPLSRELAVADGFSWGRHQARQLTREMCQRADLILVMERGHKERLCEIAPEARGKVFLVSMMTGQEDIPDPYRKDKAVFERVYTSMKAGVQAWVSALSKAAPARPV